MEKNLSNKTSVSPVLAIGSGLGVALLGFAGLVTNSLILLATWRSSVLRNKCNALIVALALSDFIMSGTVVGHGAANALRVSDVPAFRCVLSSAPGIFSAVFGIELGLILAVDRYFAIFFPFRYDAFPPVLYITFWLVLASIFPFYATFQMGHAAYKIRNTLFPICVMVPPWLPNDAKAPFIYGSIVFGFPGLGMNTLVYFLIKRKYEISQKNPAPSTGEASSRTNRQPSDTMERGRPKKETENDRNSMLTHRRLQVSLVMVSLFGILPKLFVMPWVIFVEKVLMADSAVVSQKLAQEVGVNALASVTTCSNFFIFYSRSREWRKAFKELLSLS